jgi:hypothetical protein
MKINLDKKEIEILSWGLIMLSQKEILTEEEEKIALRLYDFLQKKLQE